MCLRCVGCGRCLAKAQSSSAVEEKLTPDELLAKARHYGPSSLSAVERIFETIPNRENAMWEARSILGLTNRFTEFQIEQACAYALNIVPNPRRAFIETVLESGAAGAAGAATAAGAARPTAK